MRGNMPHMLHVVLMATGLLFGLSMGRDQWLWGIGLGFLLAEVVHNRRRLGNLERELTRRRPGEAAPAPAKEPLSPEPLPESPAEPVPEPPSSSAAVPPEPPAPREPASASPAGDLLRLARAARAAWGFFTGGNPLVRVGALVLLVGVGFLLKYLAERITVPIQWRLIGVAAGGLALLVLGIRARFKRPDFALPVQGAGLGVIFLTLFAAFRLYQVLPSAGAFALMVVVVAATVALALWQDALVLAALGVTGGFLAPVLTSTGTGSHVDLFSYYLILNAVVVAIAWFRAWRLLNWLGFVFTFGVGTWWGAEYYRPEYFATVEPFLIAHVALYVGVAVLFAARQPPRLRGLVDGTIVFATPLVGFALQAALVADREYALAWSALVLGGVYLLLAAAMRWRDRRHYRLLGECFLALGVGFVTLAVPLAFDARVTSALWCVEGAAIVWVGLRQQRLLPRIGGHALMLAGSIAFLLEGGRAPHLILFLNADFLGSALVAGAFAFVADREHRANAALSAQACWLYALAWWLGGGLYEIHWQLDDVPRLLVASAFLAVSAAACDLYGASLKDRLRRLSAWAVALAMLPIYGWWHLPAPETLLWNAHLGAVAILFATLAWLGRRLIRDEPAVGGRAWGNALGALAWAAWLGTGIADIAAHLQPGPWQHAALAWTSVSLTLGYLAGRPLGWPEWRLTAHAHALAPGLFLLSLAAADRGVLQGWFGPVWVLAFALQYVLLWLEEPRRGLSLSARHALTVTTLASLLGYGSWHWAKGVWGADAALTVALPALAPLALAALIGWSASARHWPIRAHPRPCRVFGLIPVGIWLVGWLLRVNLAPPPVFEPFAFRPLLNVLDLTCLAVLLLLGRQWRVASRGQRADVVGLGHAALGVLAFVWLNAALLRALHFVVGIPYQPALLWASFVVQASLTLLWVLCALGLMIAGARLVARSIWIAGAGLMSAAVVKLFLVDTAGSGTLARIVAFFGVAAALFLAGYLVPRPPAASAE